MSSMFVCQAPDCGASWIPGRYDEEIRQHTARTDHVVLLQVQPEEPDVVHLPAPSIPAVGPRDYMERFVEDGDEGDPCCRRTAQILAGTARRPAWGDCLPDGSR